MADIVGQHERDSQIDEKFEALRALGKSEKEIFAEFYEDLRHVARQILAGQNLGASMHATRLLHEAFDARIDLQEKTRSEFFAAVARKMRNLKIDYWRRKAAIKRGGGQVLSIDDLANEGFEPGTNASFDSEAKLAFDVHEALHRLREEYPERERVFVLKFLSDTVPLSDAEVAALLGVSREKVSKDINKARARLIEYLRQSGSSKTT